MFQRDAGHTGGGDDNYMASVQALSTLADNNIVTSYPLSAGTPAQFQYLAPAAADCQSESTMHGQYAKSDQGTGYGLSAYWQHDPHRTINGYSGATANHHDWSMYQQQYHAQQYVNGFGRHPESSAWRYGRSARYHPYAAATTAGAAATAGYRTDLVGVDHRAPVYVTQTYSNSLGDASHHYVRQVAVNARQPAYVAYQNQTPQTDYVTPAYGDYQIGLSAAHSDLNDF